MRTGREVRGKVSVLLWPFKLRIFFFAESSVGPKIGKARLATPVAVLQTSSQRADQRLDLDRAKFQTKAREEDKREGTICLRPVTLD
jgi:hypothetical protein